MTITRRVQTGQVARLAIPAATPPRSLKGPLPGAPAVLQSGTVRLSYTVGSDTTTLATPNRLDFGFTIRNPFTVSVSATVLERVAGLEYGLVQNVIYDHFEAQYDRGEMLADTVGPLLDVAVGEAPPFIHQNASAAQPNLFSPAPGNLVSASFTDTPSISAGLNTPQTPRTTPIETRTVCGLLRRFKSVTVFKVGLVGRATRTNQLFLLGVVDHLYRLAFEYVLEWDGPTTGKVRRPAAVDQDIQGTHPLVPGDLAVRLPIAGPLINRRLFQETAAMNARCTSGTALP